MFKIFAKQRGSWEEIDQADDRNEAYGMVAEYRITYGSGWEFKVHPVKSKQRNNKRSKR